MKTLNTLEQDTSVLTMQEEINGYEVTLIFPSAPAETDSATLNGVLNALVSEYRKALLP